MTTDKTAATTLLEWVKTNRLLTFLCSLLVLLFSAFVAVMFSKNLCWISPYLGLTEKNKILTFLGIGMGGILLALQAVIANRRAKAMEDTAKAQAKATEEQTKANQNTEQGQRQERLKNAIEHLGHTSDSVRLGGAYELFHLAQDTKELRQTVLDILCAHIRRTTGESKYRRQYKSKPSEEIQSLLTLLLMQDHKVFDGLNINLQGSWLSGAELYRADLRWADLSGAHLKKAFLGRAHLHGAVLSYAQMAGAYLVRAHLHGAILNGVQLQGAYLVDAQMHGVECEEDTSDSFAQRMRQLIGQESNLSGITFAGGLSQEDVDSLVKGLSDEVANRLRERLTPHIGIPESNELPRDSGAITGAYTEEEAEQWITEYEEAM